MAGIGLNGGDKGATPVVPLPAEFGVAGEGFRCGEIFGAEIFPEAGDAAKSGYATFGGDTGSG